ncbi:MAG: hypothetical protein BRD41_07655 [Bacteroidetes bacterium QS_1_63_11]|nr:MAG: hypothetical protein BRD41_07655 [Bacteroidetes bacterium QS_1_63_11]
MALGPGRPPRHPRVRAVRRGHGGGAGHECLARLRHGERRRPARLPKAVHDLDPPDRPPVLPHEWDDVPLPQRTDHTQTFEARYSDLDLNRHVNSARLLEWVLAPLPAEHLDTRVCAELHLQFRAEATLGDTVRAAAQVDSSDEERRVRHALHRADDEQALIAAETQWVPHTDAP